MVPVAERADLPGSRWRDAPAKTARGAQDRVRTSHRQTRPTIRLALGFLAAGGSAALAGEGQWLALHLVLAGAVVLAISGVSLMLTVTWSAAPAPADRWVRAQRWLIALGAAGVAVGRHLDLPVGLVGAAGGAHLAGLLLLGVLLWVTVAAGVERRFDAAVVAYEAALLAGLAGVGLGIAMAVDGTTVSLRAAHVGVNLLGLIGLVVGGTLPFFAATVGRSRMAPHTTPRRLLATTTALALALVVAALGLVAERDDLVQVGLLAYAAAVLAVVSALPRPTRRQLRWAGPRLLGLWAGALWWVTATVALALDVPAAALPLSGPWVTVLVVAGYLQILWGSLAYLVPMMRGGGHERLGAGFATTRSWLGLAAANLAGAGFALELEVLSTAALAVWGADTAVRLVLVLLPERRSHQGGDAPDA
jgi:nitrite reductase (NO-forming)